MPSTTSQLDKRTLIRAGAGAGKTTELVSIYFSFTEEFINTYQRKPKVVITTFTRKATQELKERLLSKCIETSNTEIFNLINSKSKTHISTIHGLLSQFLSQYGSEINLSPDFKIMSESEEEFLIKKCFRAIFKKNHGDNEKIRNIIESVKINILAGYFKKYYALRFQYSNLNFYQIDETRHFVENLQKSYIDQAESLSKKIKHESKDEGYLQLASQLLSFVNSQLPFEERIIQFSEVLLKPRYSSKKPQVDILLEEELKVFLKEFNSIADGENPYFDLAEMQSICEKSEFIFELFKEVFESVKNEKISKSLLTMADLEFFTIELINSSPNSAKSFAESWDYWMIDEYQDTSPIQVQILDSFIANRPYFIVGDPQQSIYSFRGARREVFENRKNLITGATGTDFNYEYRLKQVNYRSNSQILNFLNDTFTNLGDQFEPMIVDSKKQISNTPACIRFSINMSIENEADSHYNIVNEIYYYLNKNISPEKICVLSRTNKDLEELSHILNSLDIPFQMHSSTQFFNSREILDLCFLLKFFKNPFDNENLIGLLRVPHLQMSNSEIFTFSQTFISKQKGLTDLLNISLWEVISTHFEKHKAVEKLNFYRRLANQVGVLFSLKEFIIKENFLYSSLYFDPTGRREAHIWKFINKLAEEEKKPGFNLLKFIKNGYNEESTDSSSDTEVQTVIQPKKVNLMTIHASKGLQFAAVILINTHKPNKTLYSPIVFDEEEKKLTFALFSEKYQKSIFVPQVDQTNKKIKSRDAEESLRFFYVALSRAENFISITADHLKKSMSNQSWYVTAGFPMVEGSYNENDYSYEVSIFKNDIFLRNRILFENTFSATDPKDSIDFIPLPKVTILDSSYLNKSSVTDLLQIPKVRTNESWVSSAKKAVFGTHIHRFFEFLKLNPTYVAEQAKADEKLNDALNYFEQIKSKLDILKLIEFGQVEWGFTVHLENQRIQGQVDLWSIVDNILYIVDYKTGRSDYKEKAFNQIEIYYKCICHIWPEYKKLPANAVVIYPFDKEYFVKQLL